MKLSCFIIDDEPLAIEILESYISKLDSIEIAGTFGNAIKAFEALKKAEVDVLFLDIQMPKLTGVEFLRSLKNPPLVIFTTAYRDYAVDGFELNAVDYLLKPISFERFLNAVNKVQDLKIRPPDQKQGSPDEKGYFFVNSGKEKVKIRLADVLCLESKGDYVLIKTLDKEVQTHATLTSMEKKLAGENFIRVHRSFMVNINKIERWSQTDICMEGQIIPIGRSYKQQTIQCFNKKFDAL
ncbi:MAG: response regulator transcription factor [Gracilimonas sp.]|uniref:LytR/AlgR family response regulator transcription factor n=1 Tax=Gracilimonas sp. TaxID=1974203 RepID=UPI00199022EE|nr:response regulator transcription factor [Gracilimonas sp.]MBD3617369.1 response regulator transcription factor [Gracilimonas sp.]